MLRSRTARTLVSIIAAAALLGSCSSDDGDTGSAGTVPDPVLEPDVVESLEEALESVMASYDVPGAVVDVSTPEGSWRATAGLADSEADAPVTGDLVWPLRSITKSILTTVVAQLADEGALDLDDPVSEYLDGVPDGDEMTVRMLADMTSGVGDYSQSDDFLAALIAEPDKTYTLDELNAFGFDMGPAFAPGDDRVYSNTAPNVLASVIEVVTGEDVATAIHERISSELGLSNTWYPESAEDWPGEHAQGYQPDETGLETSFNNFTAMGASGGMVSDVDDMVIWAEALGSGALLSPEMHEQRLQGGPLSEGPEYDLYAMGIGEISGWWGHTGEGMGFTSLVAYDPDTASTVVVFMNISQAQDAEGNESHPPTVLLREFATILDP